MAERHESIIGWRYEGQEQVRQWLSDLERIRSSSNSLRQIAERGVGPSVLSGLDLTAQLRAYDELLRKAVLVEKAEAAASRAQRRLAIPEGTKGHIADPDLREEVRLGALTRVDAANQALVTAVRKHAAAHEAEAVKVASARRATGDAIMAARAQARTQLAENAAYDAVQVPYPNADLRTKGGRLQDDANAAQRDLVIATNRRAAAEKKSADDRLRADNQLRAAERRLIDAEDKVAAYMQAQARARLATGGSGGGGIGGLRNDFMTGFHGRSDRPYAEQIGQAFKFSVFYGTAYKLLFAFTTTLAATLQEGIEFQKAMTELKIASGASADAANDMAQSLAAQATAAGAAPSQGVILGARSLGLFGATAASGASAAEQERIAEISARVVSRMALGSKTDPMELQTQIAAVANAFGGGAQGQIRAFDLDAYLGRRFGVMPGETIQSVAESGTVGQAAGFNQEEVFAIAAALQSRTGQTSSAVAGWMAQIFSRGGEGSLTALTSKYGIDQSADLATQIQELARVYETATNAERAEIAAGFGRGKVQNAAVVLLDELPTILREAQAARTGATGEGDRIFELRMGDIGGQIQQTVAVMKAFASEMGRTGILEVLGAGVVAFRELVEAATSVIQLWNQIPGAVKATIASLALLAVAGRTAALSTGGGALLSRAGLISGSLAASTGVRAPVGGVIAGAGAAGFARAGLAAAATVAPFAVAVGGLLAIGALKQSSDRMREAQESAEEALRSSGLTRESTSSDYVASASELDMLAKENRDATGWFHNFITGGRADDAGIATAERLEEEAERRRAVADAIDARAAANPLKAPAIASWDADAVKEALDLVSASGGDANDRLRLLTDALDGTGDAALRAASAIDPDEFAGKLATQIKDGVSGLDRHIGAGSLSQMLADQFGDGNAPSLTAPREYEVDTGRRRQINAFGAGGGGGQPITETLNLTEVYEATQTQLQERLKDELSNRKIGSLTELDKGTAREIAESIVKDSDFDSRLDEDQLADARKAIINMITRRLRGEAVQWRKMLNKNTALTGDAIAVIGESIDAEFEAAREDLPENDLAGRAASWRTQLGKLLQARSQAGAGEDLSQLMRRIGRARAGLARTEIERLDQVRRAAQQNATSAAQIRRIGMRTIRGRVAAAVESGDVDVLAEVISNSGKMGVRIARKAIDTAIAAAREAIQIQAAYAAIQSYAAGVAGMISGIAGSMDDMEQLAGMQQLSDALGNMTYGSAEETLQGTDVEGTDKYFPDKEGGKSPEDRKAEREQARQEMLDLKNNLYLLSIDLSDPLAMATAAVKDARRRLQSDIASGQSRGTVAASRVALRQAEIEREATAFQQRLEAMQTAEELGRISHRKYISYLESERKRLGAIKDRTYQQQQQLDEIDRLMKDAAEQMQGQWNFGDIKLPTPYQVRRQVEQMRLDRATQLDATSRAASTVTTINIDGADTGRVRQIITETLGKANATVTNRPRRR